MADSRTYRASTTVERPPAYQEYAAEALGVERIKLMALQEKGLLWCMRNYCWVNDSIPGEVAHLARVLGVSEAEIKEAFTPAVRSFFEPADNDPTRLVCPALVRQMNRLMDRREKQASGGRKGAKVRKDNKSAASSSFRANLGGNPSGSTQSSPMGVEKSRDEKSKNELGKTGDKSTRSLPVPKFHPFADMEDGAEH